MEVKKTAVYVFELCSLRLRCDYDFRECAGRPVSNGRGDFRWFSNEVANRDRDMRGLLDRFQRNGG